MIGDAASRFARRAGAAALAAALSVACGAQTSTTQLWQARDYAAPPMRNVIVFGGGMSEPERRSLEDHVASELADHGVAASPSYQLFPELPDTQRARAEVQRRGYDGALVSTLRSVRERQSYAPGYYHGGGFWGGYYGPGWGLGWRSDYVVSDEIVDVETSLWDLRTQDGTLVWSATTQTTNPSSNDDLIRSLTDTVLPKITEAGLIPPKR